MKYLEQPGSAAARIAFLHNPSEPEAEPSSTVVAVSAALQLPSRRAKLSGYLRALFAAAAGALPFLLLCLSGTDICYGIGSIRTTAWRTQ